MKHNKEQKADSGSVSKGIAKPLVMRRFSTSLVWYHRSEEVPHEGNRIIVYSPCYDDKDPMKLRIIDSQFYGISKDAEWWAYVNCPPNGE